MQVDLSLNELEIIDAAMFATGQLESALGKRIEKLLMEQRELADMDFDDCVGGACKL